MKLTLARLFTYLFMLTVMLLVISSFAVIIIVIRHFVSGISPEESSLGIKFFIAFIAFLILAPTFHYITRRLERTEKISKDIY